MSDISEEAVRAGLKAAYKLDGSTGMRTFVRTVLEAALPYLQPEPRTVTSIEELKALPEDTVLRGRDGELWERSNVLGEPCMWMWAARWLTFENAVKHGAPFTVLHVPGEAADD